MLDEDRTEDIAEQIAYTLSDYEHVVYILHGTSRCWFHMDNGDVYTISVERN